MRSRRRKYVVCNMEMVESIRFQLEVIKEFHSGIFSLTPSLTSTPLPMSTGYTNDVKPRPLSLLPVLPTPCFFFFNVPRARGMKMMEKKVRRKGGETRVEPKPDSRLSPFPLSPSSRTSFLYWEKPKSSGLGLSLNGSQFGGCSTKYNTLADT